MLVWIRRAHCQRHSAARGKLRGHDRLTRAARLDEVVEDPVRDRFVERAFVSIRSEIKLERLAFDAEPVRDVIDVDPGEIGLAGDRTNRSEIVRLKMDSVISSGRIGKRLKTRFGRRRRNSCFASSKQSEL